ncbi:MAG: alpha/beta hydrolase, partial [Acetobacteraceae bacterium]|nr:alpha/beta hydrolase [Acetobacteraceae bacterium]
MLTMSTDDNTVCDVARPARMSPVSFAGCFGWLHAPADGAAGDVAVVLCAGLKNDAITAYRSFRLLADAMAAAGYPTLRFDYPGTGNSRDSAEPEHWAAWQRSVHAAADWLREQSGARRVVLCGLRFGATLAMVVAEQRDDVAGLLLLEPVPRGGSYIRQLSIEAMLHDPGAQAHGGLVLHELRLSRETVTLISQVDLRKVALPPACPVAVYAQTTTPVLHDCAEVWRSGGSQVTCEEFAGLEPMLRPVFMNHEPPADMARFVDWLKVAVPARSASPRQARALGDTVLRAAGYVEAPLRFGRAGNLFGILCRPSGSPSGHSGAELAVVIGNGGGLPHSAAVSVDLARRLAAAGIASLRMD